MKLTIIILTALLLYVGYSHYKLVKRLNTERMIEHICNLEERIIQLEKEKTHR